MMGLNAITIMGSNLVYLICADRRLTSVMCYNIVTTRKSYKIITLMNELTDFKHLLPTHSFADVKETIKRFSYEKETVAWANQVIDIMESWSDT